MNGARWSERRHLFEPAGQRGWLASHAAVPFAERLSGTVYKVYFSGRDEHGRSQVGAVVVDVDRPGEVLDLSREPLLGPGELGAFDDSGAMLSWILPVDSRRLWYYIGWNLGVTVPFRNSIGLAIEHADGVERMFRGPIVDRSAREPHFTASCCVSGVPGAFHMIYLACTGWSEVGGRPRHHYHLRIAESDDGIEWRRDGRIAIDFADASEYAISRPSVLRDGADWHLWFSARGDYYRIYAAHSTDGTAWTREPAPVLDRARSGWDSEMVCYPHVVRHDDRELMFYNGNGYGRTGFGVAERSRRP